MSGALARNNETRGRLVPANIRVGSLFDEQGCSSVRGVSKELEGRLAGKPHFVSSQKPQTAQMRKMTNVILVAEITPVVPIVHSFFLTSQENSRLYKHVCHAF